MVNMVISVFSPSLLPFSGLAFYGKHYDSTNNAINVQRSILDGVYTPFKQKGKLA